MDIVEEQTQVVDITTVRQVNIIITVAVVADYFG